MLSSEKIKEIEKATGIQGLQEAIDSTEVVDVQLTKTKHFTEQDYNILYDNLTKQAFDNGKYEEAKTAGEEMSVKNAKKKEGLDFEGKSVDNLVEYYKKQLQLAKESNESEIKNQYESDISKLRESLTAKDAEINEMNTLFKNNKINSPIDSFFNSLNIEVPAHIKDEQKAKEYIKTERNRHNVYFKSMNKRDVDEHGNIITLDENGNVLKDEKLQPITIDNLLDNYVKDSFVNVKQEIKGRGEKDRLPGNGVSNIKSISDLNEYAKKKGIKPNTPEMDAITIEFMKNNK